MQWNTESIIVGLALAGAAAYLSHRAWRYAKRLGKGGCGGSCSCGPEKPASSAAKTPATLTIGGKPAARG